MVIDAYTHMVPPSTLEPLAEHGGDWGRETAETFRGIADDRPHFVDLEARLELLGRSDIDRQVIAPDGRADCNLFAEDGDKLAYARAVNDGMAEVADASDGRLVGVGNVPMDAADGEGRDEMERAVEDLGLAGFAIPTNARGRPVDDPDFEAFWATVEELDVPVWMHPADPPSTEGRPYEVVYDLMHNFGWPFETTLMLTRLVFSGHLDRYPELKVVSHHLGGMVPFFLGRSMETYSAPRDRTPELPRPIEEYYRQFYYDTAVGGSTAAIRCAYEELGASQLVLATDAPFGPDGGEFRLFEYPGVVDDLDLPAEDEEAILGGNIAEAIGLD